VSGGEIMPPEICPICGEQVPRNAKACPGCGSDEQSGYSEQARTDENLDWEGREFLRRGYKGPKPFLGSMNPWVRVIVLVPFSLAVFFLVIVLLRMVERSY
jgi:hypothetical protein